MDTCINTPLIVRHIRYEDFNRTREWPDFADIGFAGMPRKSQPSPLEKCFSLSKILSIYPLKKIVHFVKVDV